MECPKCHSENRDDSRFCRICGRELPSASQASRVGTEALEQSTRSQVIGDLFAGRYRLLAQIGKGGMGVVYKAQDTKLKRFVALKFLPSELTRDTEAKERFIHEAQTASALDHPNICNIHEIDEAEGSQLFISMACYEGETLGDRIKRGPLEIGEALGIGIEVAEGLKEAHKKSIIHRDIKPGNIMLKTDGGVTIMDFGLAKLAGEGDLTKVGMTVGTVAYMSPEQAIGGQVDHRTDIWSLGVVMYEMITGTEPFKGDHAQSIIYSILNEGPTAIAELAPTLPPEIERIVSKCLEKDSTKRYETVADLQTELRQLKDSVDSGGASALMDMSVKLRPVSSLVLRIGIPAAVVLAVVLLATLIPTRWKDVKSWLGFEEPESEMWVAITPFTFAEGDSSDRAFGAGLAAAVTGRLARLEPLEEWLSVIPYGDVEQYSVTSPGEARRKLVADMVITGSMKRVGDRIQLVLARNAFAEEISSATGREIVRRDEFPPITDSIGNLSTWQDSIVIQIAEILGVEMVPERRQVLVAGRTTVPSAYKLYLEGHGYLYSENKERGSDLAIRLLNESIEHDPSYALAYVSLGKACEQKFHVTGDSVWARAAISHCDRAVKLDHELGSAYVTAGLIHANLGHNEDALDAFSSAIELDPLNYAAHEEMGDIYKDQRKYEEAATAYRRVVELRPRDWYTHYKLGALYFYDLRDYEHAVEPFRKLMELRPDSPAGYNCIGAVYSELGRREEAKQMFERSLRVKPSEDAYSNLGYLYFWERRYADAAEMFEQAVARSPDDYILWGHFAEAYYWIPDQRDSAGAAFRQAILLAERQLELSPNDPALLSDLASYYAGIGDRGKAEDLLKQVVGLEPSHPDVMMHLAEVYALLEERDLAFEWIRRALKAGASLTKIIDYPGLTTLRTDEKYQQLLDDAERGSEQSEG